MGDLTPTLSPKESPKIPRECNLPLTGRGVVHRIVTDVATIDVTDGGMLLRGRRPASARANAQETEPTREVAPELKTMRV